MRIVKKSVLTNRLNTREIPIDPEKFDAFLKGDALIQDVFPELSVDDREFILTGITPEEWQVLDNNTTNQE